jgi:hypothetical protein
MAVLALLSGSMASRISAQGQQPFMDSVAQKYRSTAAQGQSYFRGLVERVKARARF